MLTHSLVRYLNDSNQDQLLKWTTGKRIRNFAGARLVAEYRTFEKENEQIYYVLNEFFSMDMCLALRERAKNKEKMWDSLGL